MSPSPPDPKAPAAPPSGARGPAVEPEDLPRAELDEHELRALRRRLAALPPGFEPPDFDDVSLRALVAALAGAGRWGAGPAAGLDFAGPQGASGGGGGEGPGPGPGPGPAPPPETIKKLQITRADERFAPGFESLEVMVNLLGLAKETVKLTVTGAHAPSSPLFERELTAGEKADGARTLRWDGKCNGSGDEVKDRHVHPLWSPYTVKLEGGGLSDQAEFKVLYDSIRLVAGPWTPDEKAPDESDEKAWVQYRLNELGYYGGPVGKDTEDYLKKSVRRYKANHVALRKKLFKDVDDSITAELKDALRAGDNPRPGIPPAVFADTARTAEVPVEALTYERRTATTDEFGTRRANFEPNRLNRPLIPIEARILLVTRSGSRAEAPEGVGPVRVNWRIADPDEDLSGQLTPTAKAPSRTKAYLESALKIESGRSGNGDNCPVKYSGIRAAGAPDATTAFLVGDHYVPYVVEADAGQKVAFSKAWADPAQHPKRLGRAGALFRPSYIAGDDWTLRAELDFTGLPNASDLEKAHGVTDAASRIHAETGRFLVRRFGRVAMVVNWPARTNSEEWDKIREEYARAHTDVDVSGIARRKISEVITEAEFRTLVTSNTSHTDPAKITLNDGWLYGLPTPQQGKLTASKYKKALKAATWDAFGDPLQGPLGNLLSDKVRATHATGFVVCQFLTHQPVNIKTNPRIGLNVVLPKHRNYVVWGGSIGLPDSVILADQKDPDKVYYVVAHEMGHNYYLLHWENTGENNPDHHDTKDRNCIMSYSTSPPPAHQKPGVYTPHFCGKCQLLLRGWHVLAGGLPASS